MKDEEFKSGQKVWWVEYYNDIANVFEGEYISVVDSGGGIYFEDRILVKDSNGRNILVERCIEDREIALEVAYLHNKVVAETNKKSKEDYDRVRTDYWKLVDRIEVLENKKFKLF